VAGRGRRGFASDFFHGFHVAVVKILGLVLVDELIVVGNSAR